MAAIRCFDCGGKYDGDTHESCPHCAEVIEEVDSQPDPEE